MSNIPISGSCFCKQIIIKNCYIYFNHVRPERMTRKKKMGNKSHIYSERRSSNIQDFPRSDNEQNDHNSSKEPTSRNKKKRSDDDVSDYANEQDIIEMKKNCTFLEFKKYALEQYKKKDDIDQFIHDIEEKECENIINILFSYSTTENHNIKFQKMNITKLNEFFFQRQTYEYFEKMKPPHMEGRESDTEERDSDNEEKNFDEIIFRLAIFAYSCFQIPDITSNKFEFNGIVPNDSDIKERFMESCVTLFKSDRESLQEFMNNAFS